MCGKKKYIKMFGSFTEPFKSVPDYRNVNSAERVFQLQCFSVALYIFNSF